MKKNWIILIVTIIVTALISSGVTYVATTTSSGHGLVDIKPIKNVNARESTVVLTLSMIFENEDKATQFKTKLETGGYTQFKEIIQSGQTLLVSLYEGEQYYDIKITTEYCNDFFIDVFGSGGDDICFKEYTTYL